MESHDAAAAFWFKLWPQIEANKNKIIAVTGITLAILAILLFIAWHRDQNQIDAGDAVTESMITIPPNADPSQLSHSYLDIADNYAGTPAGTRALLQGATVLFAQGKYSDAQGYYQRYLDEHPADEFSGIAGLGVARSQEAQGKISEAEGTYQHVVQDSADQQSVNQARFSLARLKIQEGNYKEALNGLKEVIQADPYGSLGNLARQYAVELQSKTPPQAPAAPAPGFNLSH